MPAQKRAFDAMEGDPPQRHHGNHHEPPEDGGGYGTYLQLYPPRSPGFRPLVAVWFSVVWWNLTISSLFSVSQNLIEALRGVTGRRTSTLLPCFFFLLPVPIRLLLFDLL